MTDIKQMPREYGEMIYSLLTEMHGSQSAQLRAVNNNIANNQRTMLALQQSIDSLVVGLKESRDKRYQEEIDILEAQMVNLRKQVEEKKAAKNTTSSTSEKIRAVSLETLRDYEETQKKANSIDWVDVKKNTVKLTIGAIVVAITLYLIPQIGQLLQLIFAPK